MSGVCQGEPSHARKVRSLTCILTFLLIGLGLERPYRHFMQYPLLRVDQAPKDAPLEKLSGRVFWELPSALGDTHCSGMSSRVTFSLLMMHSGLESTLRWVI